MPHADLSDTINQSINHDIPVTAQQMRWKATQYNSYHTISR